MRSRIIPIVLGIILAAVAAITGGCAGAPEFEHRVGPVLTPEEYQRGQMDADLLQRSVASYGGDRLNGYLDRVLQRLLAALPDTRIPFRVTILDSADINARAFSNGHLFVYRNMLAQLNSESELAGLLAHEVGHVVLRHNERALKKREQMREFARRMKSGGATSRILDVTASFGEAMTQGYNRQMESEADRFAVTLLRKAGYNPAGMLKLLEILSCMYAQDLQVIGRMGLNPLHYTGGVYGDHPHAALRVRDIRKVLGRRAMRRGIDREDRNRYLQAVKGLVYGPYPDHGMIRNGYYMGGAHGVRFIVPARWYCRLIPESELIAWPDLPEGTYLHFYAITDKALDEARAESEAESDEGLKMEPWSAPQELRVNGLVVRVADTIVVDDRRPVRLAVVFGRDVKFIFQMVNATPEAKAMLDQTIESFHQLSPEENRALEVNRIALCVAGPDGRMEPPDRSSGPRPTDRAAALRFNGFFDTGAGPEAGDLIKWIK